jgi:8-oxo-dGTP pyrophosphatase MutT (NUDIX family)
MASQSIQQYQPIQCKLNCCEMFINPTYTVSRNTVSKFNKIKGGVFFYDPKLNKILIVQSRGFKWGSPKGTIEPYDSTVEDCAIRETYEETGIRLTKEQLGKHVKITKTTYYYIEYDSESFNSKPLNHKDNDASGIGWVKPECLKILYQLHYIELNSHLKKLLLLFLNFKVE